MNAAVSRLVPRQALVKAPPVRTTAHVRADFAASESETSDALAQADKLRAQTPEILRRADDDEHKRHVDDLARLDRIVARAQARREDLAAELGVAEAREGESERERQREETRTRAEAAVAAVVGKIASQYTKPAETIATFLAEWTEAETLAKAAGVKGPSVGIRHFPGYRLPDQTETFTGYLDDQGNPTQNPHPYKGDGSIDRSRTRELRTFTREVPGQIVAGKRLPTLQDTVNLPKVEEVGEHHRAPNPDRNAWR